MKNIDYLYGKLLQKGLVTRDSTGGRHLDNGKIGRMMQDTKQQKLEYRLAVVWAHMWEAAYVTETEWAFRSYVSAGQGLARLYATEGFLDQELYDVYYDIAERFLSRLPATM